MKYYVLLFLVVFSVFAQDKERVNSMYGGIVQKTDTAVLEFVQTEDKAKLYITDPTKKNLINQKLSVSAIANIKGKEYPLNLTYENDHYSLSPYAKLKDEKNFVISFTISFPLSKKVEKASFHLGK